MPGLCCHTAADEHTKAEENAVQVKQGRRAGTGMVHGQAQKTALEKRPPNCCNSPAARRVSENTASTMFSLTEGPPKRKKNFL